ncbi:putative PurR-regulated permease PerM [Hasllibacter halocynthiae]|uniref:Putative PurR-regulated permease PerM n=1 Tax=Hasllibacter halocynthiae TaxID=595589 RepID=A0A2T0XA28_9RHOB|nr:AI-2E family transporter [Hasllibacter halocynthiae]PRY95767.1 putative PurR-regulated permease PerM [Hasllibacter halocynthiae]
MPGPPTDRGLNTDRLTRDLLFVLLVVVLALAAWQLSFVLLLAFGGTLLAILFRNLANMLSLHTPLKIGVSLFIVILAILGALIAVAMLAGPRLVGQFGQLSASIPETLDGIENWLSHTDLGAWLLDEVEGAEEGPRFNILGTIGGTLSASLGILANVVILLTVAIFLAIDPDLYRAGLLHLVPMSRRPRAQEILDEVGTGLWRWLAGQALDMLAVALLTGVGLWLLGIPLPLLLGIIAGLTNFIPFVGPFLSGIPAVLVAFSQSPMDAVWTAVLFVAVQQFEGNVLLPIIQKRVAALPPVLIVLAVAGFGILFGVAGIFLATPLLLVVMILVRMLYVEDMLGDREIDEKIGKPKDEDEDAQSSSAVRGPPEIGGERPEPRRSTSVGGKLG